MTLTRSVADVVSDHVIFDVESIDRMYLNVWVPRLTYGGGVQGFFVGHRGHHYASTALMDPMTKAFVAGIHGFVAARGLELVSFGKERKDDVAQQFLARFTGSEGPLFVGRAQEKALVWRTQRRYNPHTGEPYAWLVRSTAFKAMAALKRGLGPADGADHRNDRYEVPVSRLAARTGYSSCGRCRQAIALHNFVCRLQMCTGMREI